MPPSQAFRGILSGLCFCLICLALPAQAQEQTAGPDQVQTPAAGQVQTTSVVFEAGQAGVFLDGLFAAELKSRHIPGACLAVVKDGKVVLLKGYGQADLDKSLPVDPEKTLFRVGSVSKLFVWTAIVQLVEQGKIDLKADVNTYLTEPRIPPAFGAPVTVADLLTHTPGFEESDSGVFVSKAQDLVPLAQALRSHIPARVFPPDRIIAYSNFGAALAGLIVQNVSGQPYEEYIAQHIFKPLGMNSSTFLQPLPEGLAPDMAKGYVFKHGSQQAKDFEFVQFSPAGSMSAPASDMAAFLIAQLQDGRFGQEQILSQATAQDMHARHFAMDPRLSGMGWGFYDWTTKGRRLVLHEGDTELFHTLFAMYPQEGLGVYMSFNGTGGGEARREILLALLDRYFPGQETQRPTTPATTGELTGLAGWYEPTRAVRTGYSAITTLLNQLQVSQGPEGLRLCSLSAHIPADIFRHVGPNLYRDKSGEKELAFVQPDQEPFCFYLAKAPAGFMKVADWRDGQPFQIGLFLACFLVLITGYVAWPIVFLARRGESPVRPHVPARAGWLALATGAVLAFFCAAFAQALATSPLGLELTWRLKALLVLPYLAGLMGLAMLGLLLWSLAGLFGQGPKRWGPFGQVHYSLAVAAVGGLLWFLHHWNLLSLPFLA
jgi:CubicO group peptidase (beta-lactamase class C family)